MYTSIRNTLHAWHANYNERSKLQHAYLAVAVGTVLVAGLLGLLDYDLGQRLTAIALAALAMFFINLVAWTLLSGIVLASLDQKSANSTKTPRKK